MSEPPCWPSGSTTTTGTAPMPVSAAGPQCPDSTPRQERTSWRFTP